MTDTKTSLSRVSAAQWPLGAGERYWGLSHFRVRHKHLAEQPYAEHENSPWTSPRLPKSVHVVMQIVQQTIHSRAEDPPRTFRRLSLWAHTAPGTSRSRQIEGVHHLASYAAFLDRCLCRCFGWRSRGHAGSATPGGRCRDNGPDQAAALKHHVVGTYANHQTGAEASAADSRQRDLVGHHDYDPAPGPAQHLHPG